MDILAGQVIYIALMFLFIMIFFAAAEGFIYLWTAWKRKRENKK